VRVARRLLLLAVALGAILLVVEGILRATGRVPRIGYSDVPVALVVPDRQRGYRLPASAPITYSGVTTQLDADGLRNTPAPAGSENQAPAVVALGDERTFGWGVADGDTYPVQLDAWLRARCPTCGRVVNGGVPGYGTYEGLMAAREFSARWRPRFVIGAFGLNDALMDGGTPTSLDQIPALARTSATAGLLWGRFHRPGQGWWEATPRTPLARYVRNLRSFISEVRRVGSTPMLLNIGYGAELQDAGADAGRRLRRGRLEDDYHGGTRLAGELEYVPVIDFIGPELDGTVMLDGIHPNAEGNRRIAALVGERLVAEGLAGP
jgi:lysophospholipase L1-like esterase